MDLSPLFAPVTTTGFLDSFWPHRIFRNEGPPERAPWLFQLAELRAPHDLFHTHPDDVQLVFPASDNGRSRMSNVVLSPAKAGALYPAGMTASFGDMQRSMPAIGAVARALEQLTGVPAGTVDAIGHLSQPMTGFNQHFDHIDVLIVQLAGVKCWRFSSVPAVVAPTRSFARGTPLLGELREYVAGPEVLDHCELDQEFTMHAGGVLFLPRGHWHHTEAVGGESFSISFGFRTPSWTDLVIAEIRRRLVRVAEWRQPAFGGFSDISDRVAARARTALAALVAQLPEHLGSIVADDIIKTDAPVANLDDFHRLMRATFDPAKARDTTAQFSILSGDAAEHFSIEIQSGALAINHGQHASPDFTISARLDHFLQFARRPSEGEALFAEGKLQIAPVDLDSVQAFMAAFGAFHVPD